MTTAKQIRVEHSNGKSLYQLSKDFNLPYYTIGRIVRNKIYVPRNCVDEFGKRNTDATVKD